MSLIRCPTCRRPQRRSSEANAFYWALLHEIAEKLKPAGSVYSADSWHHYFKSRFLGCDDVSLPNGKTLTIPRSSAGLDKAEFQDYVQQVEAWAADKGVFLADREAA